MRSLHKEETVSIGSLGELKIYVEELTGHLEDRHVLLLSGPLGAGKTQLVRFFVQACGAEDVSSPSFALHNEYVVPGGIIDHVDLYRLEDEQDLESMGFWDLFAKESGYILIEWADRLNINDLPPNWPILEIEILASAKHSEQRILKVRHYA